MSKKTTPKKVSTLDVGSILGDINGGGQIKRSKNIFYMGDTRILKSGLLFHYTQHELSEWAKCKNNPQYFIETYCKKRESNINLFDFQKEIIDRWTNIRFNILLSSRETGISMIKACLSLWDMIFNSKTILSIHNKLSSGVEGLEIIKEIYLNLPIFLKSQGVNKWNRLSISLGNGGFIKVKSSSPDAAVGWSPNIIDLTDGFDMPPNIQESMIRSVFPVISSRVDNRVIITGTPNPSPFYKLVEGAELPEGNPRKSQFKVLRTYWWQVPNRDEEWVREKISELGSEELFEKEYELKFKNKK
jgi:hypothetical protein